MARKRAVPPAGAPLWLVTFADLMASVLAFFVILAAYSTMDKQKMQVLAGSMNEAFGTVKDSRLAGLIELNGIPTKPRLANAKQRPISEASEFTAPDLSTRQLGTQPTSQDHGSAPGATSLRQALNDMPEIAEISKNVVIEETKDGLNISLVDQDGRSMFAEGSVHPFERTRKVLEQITLTIRRLPNRIAISGHTTPNRPGQRGNSDSWDLSMGRAGSVREIMAGSGIPDDRFASVAGKAGTVPLFPDNPRLPANRRVTITLLYEKPVLPIGLRP